MATYNEALFDAMVSHQIGLLRYSGSVRNRIWSLLDATEADLKAEILDRAARSGIDTPGRLRSLEALLVRLRESRLKGWKGAREVWFEEMRALAKAEPEFFTQIVSTAVPVEISATLPSPERLRAIVSSRPFQGKTLKGWADNVQRADLSRIEDQIKIGLVQGEHPNRIARRIVGSVALRGRDGATQVTRRQAAAITRTAVSGVSSEARREWMLANDDLAPQEVFTATLDSRTTPICRSLDGNLYDVGTGPRLPLHFGERSVYSPVIDGEVIGERPRRDFTQRQLLREYADREGIRAPVKRSGLPRGKRGEFDVFARKRMRELTGTAPAKLSYQKWLGQQSVAIQDDILGSTRGALFRRGGLTLDKFVDFDGSELTLDQLAGRYSGAFEKANLDPVAFQ